LTAFHCKKSFSKELKLLKSFGPIFVIMPEVSKHFDVEAKRAGTELWKA
jgi:hypothetical protein